MLRSTAETLPFKWLTLGEGHACGVKKPWDGPREVKAIKETCASKHQCKKATSGGFTCQLAGQAGTHQTLALPVPADGNDRE